MLAIVKLLLLIMVSIDAQHLVVIAQPQSADQPVDDLTFTIPRNEPPLRTSSIHPPRRSFMSRPSRTSSARPATKLHVSTPSANQRTSTSKSLSSGSILSSPLLTGQQANLPPFIYAQEMLNQTHANMFSQWLETKSSELFELSMNYSGFKLLDETYKTYLYKEAQPAWINFTEMIMNISQTISEVLSHKTLIVKNLTDLVEKAFDEYRNDPEKILESTKTLYYDAKSPKTFCDVQEAQNARAAKPNQPLLNLTTLLNTTTTTTNTTKSNLKVSFRLSIKILYYLPIEL